MGEEQGLPAHVTLPLLSLITAQAMDEDYQHMAERRAAGPGVDPEGRRNHRVVTAVAVGVFGLLVSVAAVQTSRNADVAALGRASLIERIQDEKGDVRALKDRAGELGEQIARADDNGRALRAQQDDIDTRVSRLGVRTGYLAVRGPGLRITVDDPPGATETELVQDEDLAMLVDGLWSSGAEAIAVNGQRLTVLSSIQNSGEAIHVNARPLTPPYAVEAIGNPEALEARLLNSTHGSVFYNLARTLGFGFEIREDGSLELPAARVRPLRSVVTGTSEDQHGKDKEINP